METVSVQLITFGLALGLALADAGKLPEATRWMMKQALHAQSQMVSLSSINRQLQTVQPLKKHLHHH